MASLLFVRTLLAVTAIGYLTNATWTVWVNGPCDVLVAFVELLAAALSVLEEKSVDEGAGVIESVGEGVVESVAGAVVSWAKPTAARPRKKASD